jgi:hypothetical protein
MIINDYKSFKTQEQRDVKTINNNRINCEKYLNMISRADAHDFYVNFKGELKIITNEKSILSKAKRLFIKTLYGINNHIVASKIRYIYEDNKTNEQIKDIYENALMHLIGKSTKEGAKEATTLYKTLFPLDDIIYSDKDPIPTQAEPPLEEIFESIYNTPSVLLSQITAALAILKNPEFIGDQEQTIQNLRTLAEKYNTSTQKEERFKPIDIESAIHESILQAHRESLMTSIKFNAKLLNEATQLNQPSERSRPQSVHMGQLQPTRKTKKRPQTTVYSTPTPPPAVSQANRSAYIERTLHKLREQVATYNQGLREEETSINVESLLNQ